MLRKKQHHEEESGESVGLWYVSFADMITLLLSFFVMLTTFSSYNKEDLTKFAGIWAQMADYSVFQGQHGQEGIAAPVERVVDWTDSGSEKPTKTDPAAIQNPRQSPQLAAITDAYQNQRVLRTSSSRLFWGEGSTMTPAGKAHMKNLATFIAAVPCQVLIGERQAAADESLRRRGLERGYTLLQYLRSQQEIPPYRMTLTVPPAPAGGVADKGPIIEILLLSGSPFHE